MEEKIISTKICVYSYNELSEADKILVENAKKASENAYAPYSKFHVGAAVRLSDGSIVAGANQENAAFPSGTCAERTAVYYAHATHPDATIEAMKEKRARDKARDAAEAEAAAIETGEAIDWKKVQEEWNAYYGTENETQE